VAAAGVDDTRQVSQASVVTFGSWFFATSRTTLIARRVTTVLFAITPEVWVFVSRLRLQGRGQPLSLTWFHLETSAYPVCFADHLVSAALDHKPPALNCVARRPRLKRSARRSPEPCSPCPRGSLSGSPGRIRTSDQPVNSELLHRKAWVSTGNSGQQNNPLLLDISATGEN
jgi:hypothetical protein